jgi:hypothetical protein
MKAVLGTVAVLSTTTQLAYAAISVRMEGWDFIPRVVIAVGSNQDCGQNPVRFDGPARRGQSLGSYPEAGSHGLDVCWRRTADPLASQSPLQTVWTRCSADGDCIVS